MGKAIGEVLPYAVGAAISIVPIIAIILVLVTPRAKPNGSAFAVGYVIGFALVGTIALVIAGGKNYSPDSGPTQTVSIVKLVLGLLLLVPVWRQWHARPQKGEAPQLPKWMSTIDSFTPGKSLGFGLLLSAVNPKNLAMSVACGLSIAQAGLSTGAEAGVLIAYIALGASTVLAPGRLPGDGGPRGNSPGRLADMARGPQRSRDGRAVPGVLGGARRQGDQWPLLAGQERLSPLPDDARGSRGPYGGAMLIWRGGPRRFDAACGDDRGSGPAGPRHA
jgi:threonine/homoserine/homoserine lactone efflux protein